MYFAEADADSVELEIRVTKEEDGEYLDKEITDIGAEIDSSSLLDFKGVVIETNKAGRVEKILESHNYY